MTLQFQRVMGEDPNVRAYFTREVLTEKIVQLERGAPPEMVDAADSPVAEELLLIPGVMMVTLRPYAVTVFKVPTYAWSEIEPNLLRFLTSFTIGERGLMGAINAEVEHAKS